MPGHQTKPQPAQNSLGRSGRQHSHASRSDRTVPLRSNPRPQNGSPTTNPAASTVAVTSSPAAAIVPDAAADGPSATTTAFGKRVLRHNDSSGESNDAGNTNDLKKWFNLSNQNPSASLDHAMDVDPPFFQKHSNSCSSPDQDPNGFLPLDLVLGQDGKLSNAPPTESSSAEDYRSVIDDLTVEIQRLKDELKRYKQPGPSPLKSEKLFELKVHGLPAWKKRELEATLREFASGLEASSNTNESSSARKKSSRSSRMYLGSRSGSKQPSSSSDSHHRRPVDSAYASMSTGHTSAGTSGRHSARSRPKYSEQKVENYLKEIPSGLYPRHITMSEKQRKKLVVRRLEQLFTGKSSYKQKADQYEVSPASVQTSDNPEPAREARILPTVGSNKKSASRDTGGSTSNSNGDQTSLSGSGHGIGANSSPPAIPPPEQRPTRPRDLDPDRVQNPTENIEYLRHLGIAPPEIQQAEIEDDKAVNLSPDVDGWVYLNLLSNLAQLHIFNVAPSFIRAAVSEKSSKFQMSADGCKIRWRGGTDSTRFSSDSSGDNMRKNKSTDDPSSPNNISNNSNEVDGEDGWSKSKSSRPKTSSDPSAARQSSISRAKASEAEAERFQYKPLFVKNRSPPGLTPEETGSSRGSGEDSYFTGSAWGASGSGSSSRRKRRMDGAIIYYSGAPFCTDLSGDPGQQWNNSGTIGSSEQIREDTIAEEALENVFPTPPQRTLSGSSLPYRPLSLSPQDLMDRPGSMDTSSDLGIHMADGESERDDEMTCDFPWSKSPQTSRARPLEPTGLGGVLPDDHFLVTVSTRRSREEDVQEGAVLSQTNAEIKFNSMIQQLRRLRTSQGRGYHIARRSRQTPAPTVKFEYLSSRIKKLKPVSLPPPAIFFPPFSTDYSSEFVEELESEADDERVASSEEAASRRVHPHQSDISLRDSEVGISASEEMESVEQSLSTSNDAMVIDEESDSTSTAEAVAPVLRPGSSVATAGGGPSGFSSSKEDSSDSSSE